MKGSRSNGIAIVASLSVVVFLLGLLGALLINAAKLNTYVQENMKISVFFNVGLDNQKCKILADSIAKLPYVIDHQFISSDQAAFNFKNEIGEDFIEVLGNNPLPATVELAIKSEYIENNDLERIQWSLSTLNEVLEVSYPYNVFEQLERNRKVFVSWLLSLSGLMVIVAIVLMVSTVRLLIYADRFLIRNQQLIGAREKFILKPYKRKAIKWTISSFILGVAMLLVIAWVGWTWIEVSLELDSNSITHHLQQSWYQYILMLFLLLVGGATIVYQTTAFAARRYLNTHTDNLYK